MMNEVKGEFSHSKIKNYYNHNIRNKQNPDFMANRDAFKTIVQNVLDNRGDRSTNDIKDEIKQRAAQQNIVMTEPLKNIMYYMISHAHNKNPAQSNVQPDVEPPSSTDVSIMSS